MRTPQTRAQAGRVRAQRRVSEGQSDIQHDSAVLGLFPELDFRVTDDINETVFRVTLKKGNCDIHSQFIGNDGKEYGAYFLYVERRD